ncbi:hypothetical protein [Sphingobacterium sp.]|uniref:hypothetical protein n=1 Tax=Sphingobacterium sp. TaxID=341027 RepID=UPI0025D37AA9|nr:hypothetical protein [Sphingobacterium sp.]
MENVFHTFQLPDPQHSTDLFQHHRTLRRNRIGYHDIFVVRPILWQLQTAFLKELYLPKDSGILRLVCSSFTEKKDRAD